MQVIGIHSAEAMRLDSACPQASTGEGLKAPLSIDAMKDQIDLRRRARKAITPKPPSISA